MSQEKSLNYTSYLALEEILGAQRPRSEEHDEAATRHGERDIGQRADRSEAMADAAHLQCIRRALS